MDKTLEQKIDEQGAKIEAIFTSVEKTRKYFLVILWVSVIGLLLPVLGIMAVGPSFMNSYMNTLSTGE